jgi:NAD(P)-dependent dehydrogenase (short-subunit alcohol dehydrogenase family)
MQQDRDVVIITGGTAGVGRATVREFARRKAIVCVIARDEERLKKNPGRHRKSGGHCANIFG